MIVIDSLIWCEPTRGHTPMPAQPRTHAHTHTQDNNNNNNNKQFSMHDTGNYIMNK